MKLILVSFLFFVAFKTNAQSNLGSRLGGMGNSAVAVKDVWNIKFNPAGITEITETTASLSYIHSLFSKDISHQLAGLVIPSKNNYYGIYFQYYGISEYKELSGGLSYAKKFNKLSIGIGGEYLQLKIAGYDPIVGYSLKFGSQYILNEIIIIGINVILTLQDFIETYPNSFVASVGLSYNPTDKVLVAISFLKNETSGIRSLVGVEYHISDRISFSAGINTLPFKQFAGFGIKHQRFSTYINLMRLPGIGYQPQIEIRYAF